MRKTQTQRPREISEIADSRRYRVLLQLGTIEAARLIEKLGTGAALDRHLDGLPFVMRAHELRLATR